MSSAIEVLFICLIGLFLLNGCVGFGTNSYSVKANSSDLNSVDYSNCYVFCSEQMYSRECVESSVNFSFSNSGMPDCSCALIKCNKPKEWMK